MNLNVFDLLLIITLTGEMYIFAKLNFEDTKWTLTRLLLTKIYLWGHFLHFRITLIVENSQMHKP